jgi:hypothetical protein
VVEIIVAMTLARLFSNAAFAALMRFCAPKTSFGPIY